MKNAGRRDEAAAAATILIAVLLGCLATSSVHCVGVPTDITGGEGGAEVPPPPLPHPLPFCYKSCGNGRCDFCCASDYTPTFCFDSEAMCKHECHPPFDPPMSPPV